MIFFEMSIDFVWYQLYSFVKGLLRKLATKSSEFGKSIKEKTIIASIVLCWSF